MSRVNCSAEARPAVLARLPRAGTDEPGEMRRKKKKGETAVEPQIHPRIIIAKLYPFASAIFR